MLLMRIGRSLAIIPPGAGLVFTLMMSSGAMRRLNVSWPQLIMLALLSSWIELWAELWIIGQGYIVIRLIERL